MYVVSASNNSIVNLTDLQIGTQLTADYQELLLSRPLLESVIDNLDLEMTPSALEGEISVSNTSGTRIMTITVTDADPEQAADIANEVIRQAKIYLPKIMETETPNAWRMLLFRLTVPARATRRIPFWVLWWVQSCAARCMWSSSC